LCKSVAVWIVYAVHWQSYAAVVQLLKTMAEHRTVVFCKDVGADMYYVVGADAEDVLVISGMMYFAEREAVLHYRLAAIVSVGDDMRPIQ
jgi:hypothetical protein